MIIPADITVRELIPPGEKEVCVIIEFEIAGREKPLVFKLNARQAYDTGRKLEDSGAQAGQKNARLIP